MSSAAASVLQTPADALGLLLSRLGPVGSEQVEAGAANGRVLAAPVEADRDSPPCDVSAMDGYAVRLEDLPAGGKPLAVAGEVLIGQEPPPLRAGMALRIYTGSAVPPEAQAVLPREDVIEHADAIELRAGLAAPSPGQHIRRRGENLAGGQVACKAGVPVTPAIAGLLSGIGAVRVTVHRKVRVAVLVTGNELAEGAGAIAPWQIRDSNGPALASLFGACPWARVILRQRVGDDLAATRAAIAQALQDADALVLTGGVSMGMHDYVPEAIRAAGGTELFHKIPIRPGKPLLGAVGPAGQVILGLPGNPVSAQVTARRFAMPALRRLAGFHQSTECAPLVNVRDAEGQTIGMWWYRPIYFTGPGEVELAPNRGSGDFIGVARSDGFVEVPPRTITAGVRPFWSWSAPLGL